MLALLEQVMTRMGPKGDFEKDIETDIADKTLQAISSCMNDRMCKHFIMDINWHVANGVKELQQLGGLEVLVKCLDMRSLLARRFAMWALATCAGDCTYHFFIPY